MTNSTNSITLFVSGNKVTDNLAGITLSPDSDNTGAYANPGVLTGTLILYV